MAVDKASLPNVTLSDIYMRSGDKLQDHLAYPPRGMRADRAAAYLGLSTSKFLDLVKEGRMPKPVHIDGVTSWDRFELDAAYDEFLQQRDEEDQGRRNTMDVALGLKR
jgi:predicted DNA-binding transcriptional regulator AlpA